MNFLPCCRLYVLTASSAPATLEYPSLSARDIGICKEARRARVDVESAIRGVNANACMTRAIYPSGFNQGAPKKGSFSFICLIFCLIIV